MSRNAFFEGLERRTMLAHAVGDFFAGTDAAHGTELWVHDAVNGDHLYADVTPGPASSDPANFRTWPGKNYIYFTATNAAGQREIWVDSLDDQMAAFPGRAVSAQQFATVTSGDLEADFGAYPNIHHRDPEFA